MSSRIDIAAIAPRVGSGYPPPFDRPCQTRERRPLGDAAGLTRFGVNLLRLPPGAWSSQRHWHAGCDELVYVVAGEVVLVTDAGEEVMRAGDAAGFPLGAPNGHHLQNRTDAEAIVLEVGDRPDADATTYSDIDLVLVDQPGKDGQFTHRDGRPY
jgi:uncharacterized cupin superfamily protein